jgi:hypothetical protein
MTKRLVTPLAPLILRGGILEDGDELHHYKVLIETGC